MNESVTRMNSNESALVTLADGQLSRHVGSLQKIIVKNKNFFTLVIFSFCGFKMNANIGGEPKYQLYDIT